MHQKQKDPASAEVAEIRNQGERPQAVRPAESHVAEHVHRKAMPLMWSRIKQAIIRWHRQPDDERIVRRLKENAHLQRRAGNPFYSDDLL